MKGLSLPLRGLALVVAFSSSLAFATPPDRPVVIEPGITVDVNPYDVHMETRPFRDADGDEHRSTDWELWDVTSRTRVWSSPNSTILTHTHLGDGSFEGILAGSDHLDFETRYALRVRFHDSRGEVSKWCFPYRFTTAAATVVQPLVADDVLGSPAPGLVDENGAEFHLPALPGPPRMTLDSPGVGTFVIIEAKDSTSHTIYDFAALPAHAPMRLTVSSSSGGSGLVLPSLRLLFDTDDFVQTTVYLPPMSLADGGYQVFWISSFGATYFGDPSQPAPDFSRLARGLPVPYQVPAGYRAEIAASGFTLPVSLAFVPSPGPAPDDPLYYVTELYGAIRTVSRSGAVTTFASELLNFEPNGVFPGSGEEGLIGIVVDPLDARFVYATLAYRDEEDTGPHPLRNKVIRLESADGGRTAAFVTDVLLMPNDPTEFSHQVQQPTFGPDGKLYVNVGDGLISPATARSDASFQGKVLRMERDGSAAFDNPFFDPERPNDPISYIYTKGLRNPFGGAWRATDGHLYTNEDGEYIDRLARMVAGRDYLWDGDAATEKNYAIYNWQPAFGVTGIAFAENDAFPPDKIDHCFAAGSGPTYSPGPTSNGKKIHEFVLDADGNLVSGPVLFCDYVGAGRATIAGMAFGPDGLYFSGLYKDDGSAADEPGASILRIVFTGVADCDASPRSGDVPLTVQFEDLSTVPDPVAWVWQFGDGGTSAERDPAHVYEAAGTYSVSLAVTGTAGVVQTLKPSFIRVDPKPVPRIESISPEFSSDRFPARIAIRGANFTGSAGTIHVMAGGVEATDVQVASSMLIRCTVPALPLGDQDIQVDNGSGSGVLSGALHVLPAGLACRFGSVNAGSGQPVYECLLVNGSAGDSDHVTRVRTDDAVVVSIGPPPSRAGRTSSFVAYAWPASPTDDSVLPLPFRLGLSPYASPLAGGGGIGPSDIWNNIGKERRLGAPTRASSPAPSSILIAPDGLGAPQTLTIQAIVRDDASLLVTKGFSVTNAAVIEVTP